MPPSSQRKGDSKCSLPCELDLPTSPAPMDASWSPQEGHTKQQQLLLEFAGRLSQEVFCVAYLILVQNSNDSEGTTHSTQGGFGGAPWGLNQLYGKCGKSQGKRQHQVPLTNTALLSGDGELERGLGISIRSWVWSPAPTEKPDVDGGWESLSGKALALQAWWPVPTQQSKEKLIPQSVTSAHLSWHARPHTHKHTLTCTFKKCEEGERGERKGKSDKIGIIQHQSLQLAVSADELQCSILC